MKRYVYVFTFVFLASPALAQQPPAKTIQLEVTVPEAQTILNMVSTGAWKDTNALMQKLIGQVNVQMVPPEAKKAPAEGAPPEK